MRRRMRIRPGIEPGKEEEDDGRASGGGGGRMRRRRMMRRMRRRRRRWRSNSKIKNIYDEAGDEGGGG